MSNGGCAHEKCLRDGCKTCCYCGKVLTNESKAREFWLINNHGEAFVFEFNQPNAIHVIEYSAYEQVCAERDRLQALHDQNAVIVDMTERDKLRSEVERLKMALQKIVDSYNEGDFRSEIAAQALREES